MDNLGHRVSLRYPTTEEVLCGPCLTDTLQDTFALDEAGNAGLDAYLRAELTAIAAAAIAAEATGREDIAYLTPGALADPLEDPVAAMYPQAGHPGHDCSHAFPAAAWLVRQPDCQATAREHVARSANPACRCGLVDLYQALEHLDAGHQQHALDAHHQLMRDMYDHLVVAETLAENEPAAAVLVARACLACLTDPAFHADELDTALTARTLELAPVIRAYPLTMTLRPDPTVGP